MVISADRPPMTTARWYGGQAAVPIERIGSSRNSSSRPVRSTDGMA